jgi:hypothetical protein
MTLAVLIALGFCGSERWDVKILTDRGAGLLQPPQKVTVEQLLSLRPPRWSSHVPRHRVERLVVVVEEMNTAYALGLKLDDVSLGAVGRKP